MMKGSPLKNPSKSRSDYIRKWCINNIETTAPAVVVGVKDYAGQRFVDVVPSIIELNDDGDAIVPDTIPACPVMLQGSANGYLSIPLEVGDAVCIAYCKRSIEEFTLGTDDQLTPEDLRVFTSSDVIVTGYWGRPNKARTVHPSNAEMVFHQNSISMSPNNELKLETPGAVVQLSDGAVQIGTAGVSAIFNADGTFVISGGSGTINRAEITSDGNVITASGTDLDAFYQEYLLHGHTSVTSLGSPTPPIPT